jgi:hypothetical protein
MQFRLRTLLIATVFIPPLIAIAAYTGSYFILPATMFFACVALVKRFLLADDATFLRD